MLPPPAPTSAMSMTGILRAYPPPFTRRLLSEMPPPTSYSSVRDNRPPSMSEALAVVPPMSRVMMFSQPIRLPTWAAPMTPAAGPHSTISAGLDIAVAASIMPPLDCIIMSRPGIPDSRIRSTRDST